MTYDWSKVSRVTLEELASATHRYAKDFVEQPGWCEDGKTFVRTLDQCRTQALVPRTRAEVDAEIGVTLRRYMLRDNGEPEDVALWHRVEDLVAEETTTEPAPRRPKDSPVAQRELLKMWDATHAEPDPCSCEEALGLRERIDRALAVYDACGVQCDSMRAMATALRG